MTLYEHIEIHKKLHQSFDQLLADFLRHNPGKGLSNTNLLEFLEWSYQQTQNPTEG